MIHTSKPVAVFVALLLLAGGGAVAWFVLNRAPVVPQPVEEDEPTPAPAPPDPRLTTNSPFRNIKPDVAYTGDARCAECHAAIATSYHAHPMGRSADLTPDAPVIEKYGAPPVKTGPYTLRAERDAKGVVTHIASANDATGKPLPDYAVRADVVIGSGTRGRSYLSFEQGSAWQTALSWYSPQEKWDVSPGFDLGNGGRRYAVPGCLFCHVDSVRPVSGATNRYEEPLFAGQASTGCERCHGPGELHARERAKSPAVAKPDHSIVNPKHLAPALQTAVCEQCHLQGEERVSRRGRSVFEFRPGMPFDEFVTVFVRHPAVVDLSRSVGQHEQMAHSKCATASGKLVCTSCHDPHAKPAPAARDARYRAKCNSCHEKRPCTARAELRADRGDSCVACHMPRGDSSNIAHASVTDHRVIRRAVPRPAPGFLSPDVAPLVAYRPAAVPEPDLHRGLGIALARAAGCVPPGPVQVAVARHAETNLTRALGAARGDATVWSGLCLVRSSTGDAPGALAAAERAVRLAPASEIAHSELVTAALSAGRFERADTAATVLVGMNPRAVEPLLTRSAARAGTGDWPGSLADAKAALAIHPLHPHARLRLAVALHRTGDAPAAAAEAANAVALATSDRQRAALREQFAAETR
jgi:hypothetical protein